MDSGIASVDESNDEDGENDSNDGEESSIMECKD